MLSTYYVRKHSAGCFIKICGMAANGHSLLMRVILSSRMGEKSQLQLLKLERNTNPSVTPSHNSLKLTVENGTRSFEVVPLRGKPTAEELLLMSSTLSSRGF